MGSGKWAITGLLIISVVLNSQTNEIDGQVNINHGHNSSEVWCEAPEKPLYGGYASESDVGGQRYNTGDTITYHCNRGHQLIGQVNRTCNGTHKGWLPDEPYCEPEYIGHLMRRLSGIEDQMRVIEQRITTFENNTLQMSNVMDRRMSTIDNKVTAMNKRVSVMNNKVATIDNNVSSLNDMLKMVLLTLQIDTDRLLFCTRNTTATNQDTATKCMTMEMGVRNGCSVSVFTWVIQDYKSKVAIGAESYNSQPFYHTVPGYKFRLRAYIWSNIATYIWLQLLPGEYDDQLKWPFNQKHNLTVLTNTGLETTYKTFSSGKSKCNLKRPTSPTDPLTECYSYDASWAHVYLNKKHILTDGSAIFKLYFYN